MIFCGVTEKSIPLEQPAMQPCSHCGAWVDSEVDLHYTFMHLYWIFGAVVRRRYLAVCRPCRQTVEVDKDRTGLNLDRDPIPFRERWGFWLALIVTLGIIAAIIVSGRNSN